jgi:serine protease inhibitor
MRAAGASGGRRRRRRLMGIVAAAGVAAACATDRVQAPGEPQRQLTAVERTIGATTIEFGTRLLREVYAAESEPNVLLSPLSASMALGMALSGAEAETRTAIRAALGLAQLTGEEIEAGYRGLFGQLLGRDGRVEIGVANAAWYERTFAVRPDYIARVENSFAAEVRGIDFMDPGSPARINAWVDQRTGGRITGIIDEIDPLDRLILVNAVYFRAPWTRPFEPRATGAAAFTTAAGRSVEAQMMMQDAPYRWFRNDDAFGVELLYADSVFSMVVVAPTDVRGIDALVAALSPAAFDGWLDAMREGRILLRMPKYRFEYGSDLEAALAALGMGVAFVPRVADFRGIAPVDDLHISAVRQNTFIDVHELGTEAAAATAVTMSVTSLPPEVTFDRPFIIAIRERDSGTLLFLGVVREPA